MWFFINTNFYAYPVNYTSLQKERNSKSAVKTPIYVSILKFKPKNKKNIFEMKDNFPYYA